MQSEGSGFVAETSVRKHPPRSDVIIVGAGISGLSLAFQLRKRQPNWNILLLEAGTRCGGTIWTEYDQGFLVEYGPNGFLANKTSTLELIRDLDLESELVCANEAAANRYVFDGHKLYRLPTGPLSLLRFPMLAWTSKWVILTERWRRRPPPDYEESVHDFIARRTDKPTASLLGELLVTGIYAGDPRRLSMAACFPRLVEMERRAGSVTAGFLEAARHRKQSWRQEGQSRLRRSQLYSLRRGLRQLIETLSAKLQPCLHTNTRVIRISPSLDEKFYLWRVDTEQATYFTTQLVLTCPAYTQAALLQDVDSELAQLVSGIPYVPIVVIALAYKAEQLSQLPVGFGYLTTSTSLSHILGAQWCSCIFPGRAPTGHVLMRYMSGGVRFPAILSSTDTELVRMAHREAQAIFHIRGEPVYTRVIRWPRAIPQYVLGHLDRLNRITSVLQKYPGLYLAGNAYYGVSLNDCTERAEILSQQIVQFALNRPNL